MQSYESFLLYNSIYLLIHFKYYANVLTNTVCDGKGLQQAYCPVYSLKMYTLEVIFFKLKTHHYYSRTLYDRDTFTLCYVPYVVLIIVGAQTPNLQI